MKRVYVLAAVAAGLAGGYDWLRPREGDLRQFDPAAVAAIETRMWRSYYDRRPAALYFNLARMLREQYRLSVTRSLVAAWDAARAAFVFKDGGSRADYERALPGLERYYRAILSPEAGHADAARLELEWWIVHRERGRRGRDALERSLAGLQAELYRLPAERFAEHARLRAEAMLLRDGRAAAGGLSEADWRRIEELLRGSWRSLHRAVSEPGYRSPVVLDGGGVDRLMKGQHGHTGRSGGMPYSL